MRPNYIVLYLFVMFVGRLPLHAAPPLHSTPSNDTPNGAIDLGLLALNPCDAGDSVLVNGTTIGAQPDFFYINSPNCFQAFSPTVWYDFHASANFTHIEVNSQTAGFDSIFVRIYYTANGNWLSLVPLECQNTDNGVLVYDFYTPTLNGNYYIQVGGASLNHVGNFELIVSTFQECSTCTKNANIRLIPAPAFGSYNGGDTVVICATIDRYSIAGNTSLHSIVPVLAGSEWDQSSLTPILFPNAAQSNAGTWTWTNANTPVGNMDGFFFDDGNGDPSDNLGDSAGLLQTWNMCWKAAVQNSVSSNDLHAKIYIFDDSQTGSNTNSFCSDFGPIRLDLTAALCPGPSIAVTPPVNCLVPIWTIDVIGYSLNHNYNFTLYDSSSTVVGLSTGVNTASYPISAPGVYTLFSEDLTLGCSTFSTIELRTPLEVHTAQISVSCDTMQAVAQVAVANGQPPYTIVWYPSLDTTFVSDSLSDGWNFVLVTDNSGCSILDSVFIVSEQQSQAQFSYSDAYFCGDQTVPLDLYPGTTGGLFTLVSPTNLPGILVDGISGTVSVVGIQPSSYPVEIIVQYTVGSACPATWTDTVHIADVPIAPIPNAQAKDQNWCVSATPPTLAVLPLAGYYTVWFDDSSAFITTGDNYTPPLNQTTSPGVYTYYVAYSTSPTGAGCSGTYVAFTITATNGFAVTSTPDTTICSAGTIQLDATNCATCVYNWQPATGLDNAIIYNPLATITATTSYTVFITDTASGCSGFDKTLITIDPTICADTLEVYHGLTPNADGKNDTWIIDGIDQFPNNRVSIYNRWGVLLWEVTGYDNTSIVFRGFDSNGNAIPDGTYFYILRTGERTRRGWLELTR